ncbi:MAG: flavohemoglobin expression-modulating QEGLA motif protein [Thermoanaerobaculia bacterium]|nr:flavohemoglobin expression-modulating QEGLA motif protein [Thermoanaerobaculia bacterium]
MHDEKVAEIDAAVVRAAKEIKVLSAIAWAPEVEAVFLEAHRRGRRQLPRPEMRVRDLSVEVEALEGLARRCDAADPRQAFLKATAESYATAGRMLSAVGTPRFTEHSIALYGRPDVVWRLQGWSPVEAARFYLGVTDELISACRLPPRDDTIPAAEFAASLRPALDSFFHEDEVEVKLDPGLSSKAIAGATRVRLRAGAMFSELDREQLLQHEAYVHAATALNGRKQPALRSLSLGAPRTTRTQEGIAVYSEIVTGAIDVGRLRRIAQRVVAVGQALEGADFLELFDLFRESGQEPGEAYHSAQRIFRGGDPRGGSVFTKDAVYLMGVLEVDAFLRIAIRDNRPELVRHLLAGRLTLADTVRLAPLFDSGELREPVYVVPWARDLRRLAAALTYSAFLGELKIRQVDLDRIVRFEDARLAGSEA